MRASPPDNWVTRRQGILPHLADPPLVDGARSHHFLRVGLIAVALGLLLTTVVVSIQTRGHEAGMDFVFYRDIGIRWLTDGTYYLPHQLTGEPYALVPMVDVLYPPNALVLFVPFAFLPAVLWWVIPLAVIGYVVWSYRPSPWAWVAIAACVAWPRTFGAVLFGNTDMWVAAAVAGGLRWGWPAALIAIKPPFLPFGLVGARHWSTWVAGGVMLLLCVPMLGEYITAMTSIRVDAIAYAAVSIPFALIPIAAWWGRDRTRFPDRRVRMQDRHDATPSASSATLTETRRPHAVR